MSPIQLTPILMFLCLFLGGADSCSNVDNDGDGVTVGDGDCDDNLVTTYPGAEEICDGLDSDCDDVVDNNIRCYPVNDTTEVYFPPVGGSDSTWQATSPEALGWNLEALDDVASYADAQNSRALIILFRGQILMERYFGGWTVNSSSKIYSSGKSVVAFMLGQAQQQGILTMDDTMSGCLGPGWSQATIEQESAITLTHLATMTSGLDDNLAFEAPPGSEWYYNTDAYYTLQDCLSVSYGMGMDATARQLVFEPTGMENAEWIEADNQMSSSARDMARFGLLIQANGQFGGEAVLDSDAWMNTMLSPSQGLNPAYGNLWWLNGQASYEEPDGTLGVGSLIPNAPNDLVGALGAADKKIHVVDSMDLVVVRHGPASTDSGLGPTNFDNELWAKIMAAAP